MRGRSHLLSCLSQVTVHDFAEASDAFLVMASDGVWEFIDSQGAVEIVNAFIEQSATEVRRAGAAEPMATVRAPPTAAMAATPGGARRPGTASVAAGPSGEGRPSISTAFGFGAGMHAPHRDRGRQVVPGRVKTRGAHSRRALSLVT